jgi:uncharacterized membrane protein YphA (DoxX/SURF4 family)
MSIYVENLIRAPIEKIWNLTQTPELHEQWDLRFSHIEYLPRDSATELQRFRYTTRIGFGLQVKGEGESVGERNLADGSRSSALKFSSTDPRSIILEGSGYWKYVPNAEGIRFITWYEYRTRFGAFGSAFDRFIFQPLMGWATAWSFDRLRFWLEKDLNPKDAAQHAFIHGIARAGLAFVFIYHGLVPKLLGPHADEIAMLRAAGFPGEKIAGALALLGVAEIILGLCFLIFPFRRWPIFVALGVLLAATIVVLVSAPQYLVAAFNPISLNLAVAGLAIIDLIAITRTPSAARCRRKPAPS